MTHNVTILTRAHNPYYLPDNVYRPSHHLQMQFAWTKLFRLDCRD